MKLRSIRVRSMPGIDEPLEVSGFGDGLTVLRGSNASGKSRLAHAVRAVLWGAAGAAEPIFADVTFDHEGELVVARRDDAAVTWSGPEGERSAPVTVPESQLAGAFSVRADDVLAGSDQAGDELRGRIARELTGNVDLAPVRERFRVPAGNAGSKERDALRTATRTLDDVRATNLALLDREQRELPQLRRDQAAARTARERLAAIVAARSLRALDVELADLEREVAALPDGVDRVPADAARTLQRYRDLAATSGAELEQARGRREALVAERASIGAARCLEPGELDQLNELRDVVRVSADAHDRAVDQLQAARAAAAAAQAEHGVGATGVITPAQVAIAERLVGQAADARVAITAADKAIASANRMRDAALAAAATPALRADGSRDRDRDRAAAADRRGPTMTQVVALGGSGVLGWFAAAVVVDGQVVRALLGLLAAATLVLLVLARAAVQRARDGEVPLPVADDAPARAEVIAAELLAHAGEDRRAAVEVLEAARAAAIDLAGHAGVRLDVEELPSAALAAVLQQVARVTATVEAVATATAALDAAARRRSASLAAFAVACAEHGIDAPGDTASVAAAVGRIGQLDAALATIERELSLLDDTTLPELARRSTSAQAELASLLAAFGLEVAAVDGSDAAVDVELARRLEAAETLRAATPRIDALRRRRPDLLDQLVDHDDVRELDDAELDEEHAQLQSLAAEHESITERIGAFENDVRRATRDDDVDRLDTVRATAELALDRVRERVLHAGAGSFLLARVEQAWGATSQPEVVALAARTFAAFTHHRYELQVGEAGADGLLAWRVRDVESTVPGAKSLDELSSGTRAQLLLAVRLAFVEVADRAGAIPVVIDEALATTDPGRFDAVARALAEHARSTGRQVVYLASSDDAVARIQRAVPAELVAVVDVDRERADGQAPPVRPEPLEVVPEPGDLDPVDYAAVVGAAPLDPHAAAGAIALPHVLHAAGEQGLVHRLLIARLDTAGRFERALALGAAPADVDAERVSLLIDIATTTITRWRVGRPPMLPAHALDQAELDGKPVISATYRDAVLELLAQLDGDTADLVQALDDKRVKGFRAASVEALRAWGEQQGYLDGRPQLDEGEAALQVQAELGVRAAAAGVSPARVAEAVHHVWQLAEASAGARAVDRLHA